jgi:uncharacterized protein YyaL (SSP411 family)
MKNNLIFDTSPYLQQHKNNPVHWQTWNKEILSEAKRNKKPILLSIGYAACHWCHVMAHESFEDKETADLMNNYFINIKVDREERPDIDFIFQSSYQLFNQSSGGWPLTMFLDENAIPFMGGTYFPNLPKHGLPSFKEVIIKASKIYNEQKEEIIKQSSIVINALELKKNSVLKQDLEAVLEKTISNLDEIRGGYKGSPKFPIFNVYDSILYFYNKTKNEKYLKHLQLILSQLCSAGIYDHVEGGISRYTVDEDWLTPHFEKMLYDNAQFVFLLSKYLKIKKNIYFEKKIKQTINFINKNFLNLENNLLGSAYDADSDGEEGKYYTYTYDEVKDIKDIEQYFEISQTGNWEGKIILKEIKFPPEAIIKQLAELKKDRKKPFFDKKTQLDLNCLWTSALISSHNALPNEGYLKKAEDNFIKIEKFFFNEKELFHSNSKSTVFLEDYAYAISMLLDLSDATFKINYLMKAKDLCKKVIEYFYISEKSIFQKNKKNTNDLFHNPIDISDHTLPNGNGVMLLNFSRLGMKEKGKNLCDSLNGYLNVYGSVMISSLKSVDYFNMVQEGKSCNQDGCKID